MGPCNCSSATNSAVELPVVSRTTANTANRSKALALIESLTKRSLFQDNGDNGENEETRIAKKPRESVMEANNTVVGSDNEESEEDWNVEFKLPLTELVYSEQYLAER